MKPLPALLLAFLMPGAVEAQALTPQGSAPPASAAGRSGLEIVRAGSIPAQRGSAQTFTGQVEVSTPFRAQAPGRASGAMVRFEAGARTAWHRHPLGQTLIVTAGRGRVQVEGGPVEEIGPGDVVWIPAGKRHWHGAAPTSAMSHFAITETLEGKTVEWMEPVTEAQYGAAPNRHEP